MNSEEHEPTNYNEDVNFESESRYEPGSSGNSSTEDETDLHQNRQKINKRKRKSNKSTWERQINKRLRMEGKVYKSSVRDTQGKRIERAARKLGDVCNCNSIARSCSKITQEVRKEIFDAFWNLSWNDKKNYVRSLVIYKEKERCYVQGDSRRKGTFIYNLQVGNNEKLKVCKKMYLGTLGVKERSVREWVTSPRTHGIPKSNSIVKAKQKSTNKQLENKKNKDLMIQFIKSIPKLPSHYCRVDTKKLYLEENFKNKTEVYNLYIKHCEQQQNSPLSICTFMDTLSEMNIAIHRPKKDQCDLCCSYKVGNTTEEQYKNHMRRKKQARNEKKRDKEAAIRKQCYMFTMDVQAVKLCPMLYASKLYFKSKLQVHNFSLYNLSTHHCVNYCWNETEGELVASVFTTCIIKHLEQFCMDEKKPIIIYSDGCGYQNRNAVLANALLNLAVEQGVTIFQKFLEKGHTQMEVDSAHALIERKLKGKEIHIPSQYPMITREARKNPFPFEAHYLTHEYFIKYDLKESFRYQSIRPGKKKDDPTVNDLKCLRYSPDGIIYYKTDYGEENYIPLPVRPHNSIKPFIKRPLYKQRVPITRQKYNHLQELTQVLPQEVKKFYEDIPFCDKNKD